MLLVELINAVAQPLDAGGDVYRLIPGMAEDAISGDDPDGPDSDQGHEQRYPIALDEWDRTPPQRLLLNGQLHGGGGFTALGFGFSDRHDSNFGERR